MTFIETGVSIPYVDEITVNGEFVRRIQLVGQTFVDILVWNTIPTRTLCL